MLSGILRAMVAVHSHEGFKCTRNLSSLASSIPVVQCGLLGGAVSFCFLRNSSTRCTTTFSIRTQEFALDILPSTYLRWAPFLWGNAKCHPSTNSEFPVIQQVVGKATDLCSLSPRDVLRVDSIKFAGIGSSTTNAMGQVTVEGSRFGSPFCCGVLVSDFGACWKN